MRKYVIIEIENTNVGNEEMTGVDEALFDFGVQNPRMEFDPAWPSMSGLNYSVESVRVVDTLPPGL